MNYYIEPEDLNKMDIHSFHSYFSPLYSKYYKKTRELMKNGEYHNMTSVKIDFKKIPLRLQYEKEEFTNKTNEISDYIINNSALRDLDEYCLFIERILQYVEYTILVFDCFSMYYSLISTNFDSDEKDSDYDIYLKDAKEKSSIIKNIILDNYSDILNLEDVNNFNRTISSEFNSDFLQQKIKNIFN